LLLVAHTDTARFFLAAREIDEFFPPKGILEKFHTTSGRSLLIGAFVTREARHPESGNQKRDEDRRSLKGIQARSGAFRGISIERI